MKIKRFSKAMACVLSACMIFSSFTVAVSAASASDYKSETHDVFKHTESKIAPGVDQYINYAYAKDGKQMVYYVATADISRDDVEVHSAYKDAQCTNFGMDKLTNQMAAANKKYTNPDYENYNPYFEAVAGVNGDFYNMQTGQPSGAFVMDGTMSSNKANNRPFFAIMEDGTALCGANNAQWDAAVAAHGKVMEAVGGSQMLVVDGKDVTASASGSYNTDRHSRTMVGVTADGKVVMTVLDGRQEPFSCGGTMHELAQIMLEAGCVSAINLDGGGSTTFAARPEGESEVKVINRPSDGSERSISSGLLIASTAAPSDTFDHSVLTADNEYVTPGSTVNISAKGVSPAGTAADIPADVSWQLSDTSMGSVENGVFVSSGNVGDAVIQMVYNGNVVGETTVHVVIPTAISFDSDEITVPFGKTVELGLTATCNDGLNEVVLKAGDVAFTLDNSTVGTINGFDFTAGAENDAAVESNITAEIVYDSTVTATSKIKLGKGSEVLIDFEDGTNGNIGVSDGGYNYYLPNSSIYSVTKETGMVHDGNRAIALNIDYSNSLESGYQRASLYFSGETIYRENAKKIGMWIYIPDECVSLWARWQNVDVKSINEDGSYKIGGLTGETIDGSISGKSGYVYTFEESGWHYLSMDISSSMGLALRKGHYFMQFYISDRGGDASTGYLGLKDKASGEYTDVNGNFTFYIDDITVDYSSAVDDREAPVFSELNYGTTAMSDAVPIAKRSIPTINNSNIDFAAKVAENTSKGNASGLDITTAKAYVDGNEVACSYAGGAISMDKTAVLSDGEHTIKFSICDMQGNYASIIRKVNIQAGTAAAIKVVAHDQNADKVLFGSINYIDVVATNAENIESVSMKLDLDSMSDWQLEHIDVADGFEVSYSMTGADKADNIVTLNIKRKDNTEISGETVLASIPVRMWALDEFKVVNGKTWNYAAFKAGGETWPVSINLNIDKGTVNFKDGTTDTFTGESIRIQSEMLGSRAYMTLTTEGTSYWNSWNGGHIHTAEAVADKAATCTESGYTGRTFCEVCNSVVEWGTTIPATGHTYETVDGTLKCKDCGELFNGEYTDGKTYFDGVVASGLVNGKYYVDGVLANNYICIDDVYYIVENGVKGGVYTGLVQKDGKWCYSKLGNLTGGWTTIDNDWYYFDVKTFAAVSKLNNGKVTFSFEENGKLSSGEWYNDGIGTRYYYGPAYYLSANSTRVNWQTIDGNTYGFDEKGYRYEGIVGIVEYVYSNAKLYEFTNDGILIGPYDNNGKTGLVNTTRGETYYVVNGELNHAGLIKIDGAYYYIDSSCKAAKNITRYIMSAWTNGIVPEGSYSFDADGKMLNAPAEPEEIHDGINDINGTLYYYLNGELYHAGIVKIDGAYYYVNSECKVVTNSTRYVMAAWANGLVPEGTYSFGEDGKMLNAPAEPEEIHDGINNVNGTLYYYLNGELYHAGMVKIDGAYYYVNSECKVVTNSTRYVMAAWANGLVPEGTYSFGEDGKMLNAPAEPEEIHDGINNINGTLYYYLNGEPYHAGIVEIDGDYYYVNSECKVVTNSTRYVMAAWANGLVREGTYTFDADGKMVLTK